MATWNVQPTYKKSVIERQRMYKDGQSFIVETGWRWGEFLVFTDDDNPPDIEAGVDIYDCGYDFEFIETLDGCWTDYVYDKVDAATQAWLEEFFEDNSSFDLDEHGWDYSDCEMIIECDLAITRVDDESETATETTPVAEWPFSKPEPIEVALTDWFPVDVEPVHVGRYEVLLDDADEIGRAQV